MKYVARHPELGQSPEGFDCSGFVKYVLQKVGLFVPDYIGMDNVRRTIRHANEFWDHYGIFSTAPDPGNLVIFARHGAFPTHIGIVHDEESFIHSPGQNGLKIETARLTLPDINNVNELDSEHVHDTVLGFKEPVIPLDAPCYRYHQAPLE